MFYNHNYESVYSGIVKGLSGATLIKKTIGQSNENSISVIQFHNINNTNASKATVNIPRKMYASFFQAVNYTWF